MYIIIIIKRQSELENIQFSLLIPISLQVSLGLNYFSRLDWTLRARKYVLHTGVSNFCLKHEILDFNQIQCKYPQHCCCIKLN